MILPLATSTLAIVLVVIGVLAVLLGIGGYIGATRRAQSHESDLERELEQAERALAQAHADDKGWDPATLEAAARAAARERFGADPIEAVQLVRVIDMPGTEADQAIFRVQLAGGDEHRITLGRSSGAWGPA